jgi:2-polyprenyl-6-methoxyphenol hydroxylase-like FAD-dependent oxidoreductase
MGDTDAVDHHTVTTRCCIVGGGPAGMMAGLLLARAGVDVVVLEKHADFLRDFRGDTIHPSTLEVMHEIGLLDALLKLPHQELHRLAAQIGDERIAIADFSRLPTRCKFIALMPQWDFLNFLAAHGARHRGFGLRMQAEVTDLVWEGERIVGVRGSDPSGPFAIAADLVIAADGRHSVLRERAGLTVQDLGAPIDVFWMPLSRRPDDSVEMLGRIEAGGVLVMLNRGDYWQCALVIRKGEADAIRQQGLEAFRARIARLAPFLADRVGELRSFGDVKLLTVRVDRLPRWYRTGLICIGDAAHAMSPVGGVGINLAIQDAVAAANALGAPLRRRAVTLDHLHAIQRRRMFPTRVTQRLQLFIQDRVLRPVLMSTKRPSLPWIVRLMLRLPLLQRIPAYLVGVGVRAEHVASGDAGCTPGER